MGASEPSPPGEGAITATGVKTKAEEGAWGCPPDVVPEPREDLDLEVEEDC